MASIEDRIVHIEFDNGQFERGVSTTLASLAGLEEALAFGGVAEGVNNLSTMASAVESINSKFSALGAVAFSVIQKITEGALGFIKKFSGDILGPIITGGTQRAKNIEQAKFMFKGLGIDIQAGMDSALAAVQGTAFGLDEAAKAAAQFGASGIKVGSEMTGALRGVAGAAAMTGSSFTEMADIFAGSAGTGKVTNMDLMQFATRGLNAAAAIGKVLGKTEAQVHEMAKNGTLDFKTFAGAMDKAFGEHATKANETFTGALANMKAAMSRLGAAFVGPQLVQQRDLFNAITPVIDNLTKALAPLILTFTMITGTLGRNTIAGLGKISFDGLKKSMPDIVKGMAHLFTIFNQVSLLAKGAFKQIFPPGTETVIQKIAEGFRKLSEALLFGSDTAVKIMNIFRGIFAVLSIGWTIVKEGAKFIFALGRAIFGLSDGKFLDFASGVGNFATSLQEMLVKGGGIADFFKSLTESISSPVAWLKKLVNGIRNLFDGFDETKAKVVEGTTGRISDRLDSLRKAIDRVKEMWRPFGEFFGKVGEILGKAWEVISGFFSSLGSKIAEVFSAGDYSTVLDTLNTGLLAVITAAIVRWWKSGFKLDIAGGFFDSIKGAFDQLTGTLKTLQVQIKAEAIKKIAIAIAILTASMVVLSLIDSKALTKALIAMSVGFAQLMGAFAILTKLTLDPKSAASFSILAIGMIALAAAMTILAVAATILARLDWGELARGLLGVLGLVIIVTVAARLLGGQAGGMIAAGVGISALAVGLLLMAGAVKVFASMSWGELARGLIGLAAGLILITAALLFMPPHMALMGLGLVGVGIGLMAMGTALKIFASMSWAEIGRGIVALAGGLALIAAAVNLMPGGMIPTGLGLVGIGIGLGFFAQALQAFGSMSWDEIARGLTALAGSMVILAIGVTSMSGALLGAVALGVVSASLLVLAGVLKVFGKLGWDELLDGLGRLGAAIGLIALASILIGPAVPAILGLAVALGVLGLAFLVFGGGAMLVAKAFEIMAKAGKSGSDALVGTLQNVGRALPAFATGLAKGILEMIQVFADGIGKLLPAFGKIIASLLTAMENSLPQAVATVMLVLDAIIVLIYQYAPQFSDAGIFMLMSMLNSIRNNIGELTTLAIDIVVGFLDAIAGRASEIANAGMNMLLQFIAGISDNIANIGWMAAVIIVEFMRTIANMYGYIVKHAVIVVEGFLRGLSDNINRVINAGVDFVLKLMKGISDAATRLANSALIIIITFLSEMQKTIDSHAGELGHRGWLLMGAIINGLTGGLAKRLKDVATGLVDGLKDVVGKAKGWLKVVGDPYSLVFVGIGEAMMNGMTRALDADTSVEDSAVDVVSRTTDTLMTAMAELSNGLADMDEFNPTITPVLDLTKIAADASLINDYIQTSQKISPNVSLNSARTIAATTAELPGGENAPGVSGGVLFQQTINSPTRLSTVDIYKQTRNQITIAKEELAIP